MTHPPRKPRRHAAANDPWSAHDLATLAELWRRRDLTTAEIALILGRSEPAVRLRRHLAGLPTRRHFGFRDGARRTGTGRAMTLQGRATGWGLGGWCLDLAWRRDRDLGPSGTPWRPRLYRVRCLDIVALRRHGIRRQLLVVGLAVGPVKLLLIR